MSAAQQFDFAVLGTTPVACLMAGLLATAHGKRVCLVSETHSTYRLTRGVDLSMGLITRPETWALLGKTVEETRKLIRGLGAKGAISRIDPLLVAEHTAGAEALGHVHHMGLAFGAAIERLPTPKGSHGTTRLRVRDVLLLDRVRLGPPIAKWLEKSGVQRYAAESTSVAIRRDGGAAITADTVAEVAQVIAADDAAILAHLEPAERERLFRVEGATTILLEASRALPAPAVIHLEKNLVLAQRHGGSVEALAAGRGADAVARIGSSLGSQKLRSAGQTSFRTLVPLDSAPVVGLAKAQRIGIIAGLGSTGAFQVPALARHFAGSQTEEERRYFATREPGRGAARLSASDIDALLGLGSAQ